MRYNERKAQALQIFACHGELRPPDWVRHVRPYVRSKWAYWYLKRLWRFGYLRRSRDWRGRILYRLSQKGAEWRLQFDTDPEFRKYVLMSPGARRAARERHSG